VGGNILSLERESETAANVTRRYGTQQCQYALVSLESYAHEVNKKCFFKSLEKNQFGKSIHIMRNVYLEH
jgi:hypothetical protein